MRVTRSVAAVLVLGVLMLGAAESALADSWVGATQGKVIRSSRWVSTTGTARGDFWFDVGRRGRITGRAVVAYEPAFDTDRLNALVSYARSAVGVPLSAIPIFGGLANAQLGLIVGVRISYPDPMPIREGKITGRLHEGRLTIRWAGRQRTGIPFRAVLATLDGDQELTSGSMAAPSPWPAAARVTRGRLAISTRQSSSTDDGEVTETLRSYWSARRVGR